MSQASQNKVEYPFAGLSLPAKTDQKDSFFHNKADIENWIESLPLASPIECAKLVFKNLFEMNRTNMEPKQRILVLEIMAKTVENITIALKSRFSTVSFPLAEKNHKIALLTREICKEMAIGYKSAIADQIQAGNVKDNQQSHIIAINRVIYFLSRVLFFSYNIYEAHPTNTWHELHLIFTYSSINKFDRTPVENIAGSEKTSFTVKQLYLKILLLATSSPYQLRQREMETLYNEIDQFLLITKLSVISPNNSQTSGFVINLHVDKPPVHIETVKNKPNKQFFLMDTQAILEIIQHSISPHAVGEETLPNLSIHLKNLLLKNWGNNPNRQYVRTKLNFDLDIAVGLNEIHQLLTKSSDSKKSLYLGQSNTLQNSRENLQRSSLFLTEQDDLTNSVLSLQNVNEKPANTGTFLSSQKIDRDLQINADELITPQQTDSSKLTHSCKTVNESNGGYCIDWPKINTPKIRVGELVGIQSTSQAVEFGLAITRWIKCLPNDQILVGIEIISHNSNSLKARIDKVVPKHKTVTYYPALSISNRAEDSQYLIAPSDLFNLGDILILKNNQDTEKRVKLANLVESTGLFSQYQISEVATKKNQEP